MKTRTIIILFLLALVTISGQTIAQAACQNTSTVDMSQSGNMYNSLDSQTNCITIIGFPSDAEAVEIYAALQNSNTSDDTYDVYIYPGSTNTFTGDYSLTQQRALGTNNPLLMDLDSFFTNTYTLGVFARQPTAFQVTIALSPITKLSDAVPSYCGKDNNYCENQFAGASDKLTRMVVIHCPGKIQVKIGGDIKPSSQSIKIFAPLGINPVAEKNGKTLSYEVSDQFIVWEGFWKVEYEAKGLRDKDNPRLYVTAPRGDCRSVPKSTPTKSVICRDSPPTLIKPGMVVIVQLPSGSELTVLSSPDDTTADGLVSNGTELQVVAGPVCSGPGRSNLQTMWEVMIPGWPQLMWVSEGFQQSYFLRPK